MSGSTLSTSGLDVRRKRILFRCWHRGMKEMDLLLGRFADARLSSLSEGELDTLEDLMEIGDQELFSWMSGRKPVPKDMETEIYRDILSFHETKTTR
ncbi:MAG: succinate dehydrogenase assembly factor 2 [Stappiaceae bacterium]